MAGCVSLGVYVQCRSVSVLDMKVHFLLLDDMSSCPCVPGSSGALMSMSLLLWMQFVCGACCHVFVLCFRASLVCHMCVFCIECVGISMHLMANVCMPHTRQLLVYVRMHTHVCLCARMCVHTCMCVRARMCVVSGTAWPIGVMCATSCWKPDGAQAPLQSPHSFVLCATKKYLRFPRLIIFPPQSLPDVSSVVPVPMATEVPAVVVPFCGACPGSWHYCKPRGGGEYRLVKDILRGTLLEWESRMDNNRRQG